ncbi:MAG: bacterioferritin-associated ferredoxin [Chromatiales bacterium]|nr:bacterioferritin-associated ferredoxin [Chromatiales bacterium]
MYVCVCNGITDRQIRAAVDNGAHCLDELRDSLGVASCCGRCADCARRLIREAQIGHWDEGMLATA